MPLLTCPHCRQPYFVPGSLAGKVVPCPGCNRPVTVSADPESPPFAGAAGESLPAEATGEDTGVIRLQEEPLEVVPVYPEVIPVAPEALPVLPEVAPARRRPGVGPRPRTVDGEQGLPRPGGTGTSGAVLGVGIASLVTGIVATPFALIPAVGVRSLPVAAAGLLLSCAGLAVFLVRRSGGAGFALAGLVANAVAFGAALVPRLFEAAGPPAGAVTQAVQPDIPPPPTPEVKLPAEPPAAAPAEWVDAFTGATLGDVRVQVTAARVDFVRRGGEAAVSKERLLQLTLRVENTGRSRAIKYRGWGTAYAAEGRTAPRLADDAGTVYGPVRLADDVWVEGRVRSERIAPGGSVTDLLVFETPTPKAERLRLELPGENVETVGALRLEFPVSVVQRPAPRPGDPTPAPPAPGSPAAFAAAKYRAALAAPDAATRRSSVAALRELGAAAEAVPELAAALRDPDPSVRAAVAEALADLGRLAVRAYGAVLRSTADEDPRVRRSAEGFFKSFGRPPAEAVAEVIAVAGDANAPAGVRVRALATLGQSDAEPGVVVPAYVASLNDPDVKVREQAVRGLAAVGKFRHSAVLSGLLVALADTRKPVRELAAAAVAQAGRPDLADVPALQGALKSESTEVRLLALRWLGEVGRDARDAAPEVVAALEDTEAPVRLAAVRCLFEIAPTRYVDAAALLADPEHSVREQTADVFRHKLEPGKCFETFADALSAGDPASRADAARALGQVELPAGDEVPVRTQSRLSVALSDSNPYVRLKAAKALQRLGWKSDRVPATLAGLLGEGGDGVAREAAEALSRMGEPATRAVAAQLSRALSSKDAETRRYVAAALRSAGPLKPAVIPDLLAALADAAAQDDVAALLAAFGEKVVGELVTALGSPDADTRAGAAKALGLIGPAAADAYKPLTRLFQKDSEKRVREEAGKAMDLIRRKK